MKVNKMWSSDMIFSFNEVNDADAQQCGGKFLGLREIRRLLNTYNQMYRIDAIIPETFAIPFSFHEKYKNEGYIPESLVNEAMKCVVACGGNVAVRSSADVEDAEKSYSGVFKSVLNVKTKKEMREALKQVYASAEAVPDAHMGIIIQKMIEKPEMAGVAYSESFFRDQFIVLNYTTNEVADELLATGHSSNNERFAVAKTLIGYDEREHRLSLCNYQSLDIHYMKEGDVSILCANTEDRKTYSKQFMLSALICGLEKRLGYPVDVEFAFSQSGELYILQQRPYLFPDFIEERIADLTYCTYDPENPTINGEAVFYRPKLNIFNDKGETIVTIDKDLKCDAVFCNTGKSSSLLYDAAAQFPHNDPFGGLLLSGSYAYSHGGNGQREDLDFSELWTCDQKKAKEFERIQEGDKVEINLKQGNVRVCPQNKRPSFKINCGMEI